MTPERKRRDRSYDLAELRISIRDITPEIWRLVQASRRASLFALHGVIQDVFGWNDAHLWAFIDRKGTWYAPPSDDGDEDGKTVDVSGRGLHYFLKKTGDVLSYVYDWGDNWKHDITLMRFIELDDPHDMPFYCVAGERAGPHEDSGGAEAHMRCCAILENPTHPEYEELRAWIGEDYDPEAFSARQANQLIRRGFV